MRDTQKYRSIYICVVLALITIAVFWQVCTYDFVNYDDPDYVYENPAIQSGITLESIKWALTTTHTGYWHPLTWLSLMLDCQLFGNWAGGYHLTNVFLHIINTVLLFCILMRMTGAVWSSAFVAAAFALHPLHVESVAWIAERKDLLSTFFWLLAIWAYLRYAKHPGIARYLLLLLIFILGLMAKPMVVTLPFVLLVLDYWPLERLGKKHSLSYLLIEKIPLFAIVFVLCIATFIAQKEAGAVCEWEDYGLLVRLANASISYLLYIIKMIWPTGLTVFYPHAGQNISILDAIISAVLLLAVTGLIFRFSAGRRYLLAGWFWYLGILVPVIGLVQVGGQAHADRYSYIALTGLFIIIAWVVPDLLAKWQYKKIALTLLALVIILAMSICSRFQLRYWQNSLALFQHALDVTEDNYIAHFGISEHLRKQGRLDEAIYHCSEVTRLRPGYLDAQRNLAYILYDAGRVNDAIKECRKYLQMEPDDPNVLNALGVALSEQGKSEEAIENFTEVLRIKPDFTAAHTNIGYALSLQGNLDEAVVHLTEAIRLDPHSAIAHYYLGQVLTQKRKIKEAITHFEEALRLKPDWLEPMNNLAWFEATSMETAIRNPDSAVGYAQRACELTNYKEPRLLDTLSVAYAAASDFTKAIETAEKALELCQSPEWKTLKEEIESRLILYRAGKPYIKTP